MDQKHIHNLPSVKIKVSTVNEERKLPSEYSVAPLKGLFISSERQVCYFHGIYLLSSYFWICYMVLRFR